MMLTELCHELKNYFLRNREADIHSGTFTISEGVIEPLSFLAEGQYYRIVGSVFNDGVHKYGDPFDTLTDETFDGAVWAMYVPPAFVDLASEIETWVADNSEAMNSPYQSESFGGYSYSKGSTQSGAGGYTWVDQFAGRLKNWRRIHL